MMFDLEAYFIMLGVVFSMLGAYCIIIDFNNDQKSSVTLFGAIFSALVACVCFSVDIPEVKKPKTIDMYYAECVSEFDITKIKHQYITENYIDKNEESNLKSINNIQNHCLQFAKTRMELK